MSYLKSIGYNVTYMKILVCIKAVPDPEQVINSGGDTPEVHADESTEMRLSRFDEFVVEESVLIKECYPESTIDAISVGPEAALKAVKRAMGMGADFGIHIVSDYQTACDAVSVSGYIAQIAAGKNYDLILCGIMSEDMMQFQVGPMLAQRMGLPWTTAVIHETVNLNEKMISVERELEGGLSEMLDIRLPALLTVQSGINEPRYPSLSKILRATDSVINTISVKTLKPVKSPSRTIGYSFPEKKRAGLILEGTSMEKAETLLRVLREKGFRYKAEV